MKGLQALAALFLIMSFAFASGFALATRLASREYVCARPVKTITFVKDLE